MYAQAAQVHNTGSYIVCLFVFFAPQGFGPEGQKPEEAS